VYVLLIVNVCLQGFFSPIQCQVNFTTSDGTVGAEGCLLIRQPQQQPGKLHVQFRISDDHKIGAFIDKPSATGDEFEVKNPWFCPGLALLHFLLRYR